ncbi:hypothetical protein [Amphiplicatus metriothermophilus]|uniref:Lipoprotein n=1 Tax=Amphiplicatus metriothermophilus TaxID=1519374 RepID=A0A239PLI6_9PROT|nr:hypothetical protein [Amphiplicatus metriothermophilus]MBB5517229.1 hypothetical protein [Amphiplicatus metriothermophilus]SNT68435.1 hypothetical protein SAMN06297382_0937 [Amphiplicatus metriothermophilus]
MKLRPLLLAGTAALALASCGKKEEARAPETATSAAAARVDAPSPLDKPFALKGAEAVEAEAIFALLPAAARPTYENASFDAKLGATVVTGLRFADEDGAGDALLVERAELYGVDLDAVERVKAAETAAPDSPFETVFQKVRLFGVRPEAKDEAEIVAGAVELDRLRLRQGAFSEADTTEGGAIARFFNAFDLAGLYYKDFSFKTAGDADIPAIALEAPDLRFVGLGGGRLQAVVANDLVYRFEQTPASQAAMAEALGPQGAFLMNGPLRAFIAPQSQRGTIETFDWRGVDLSGWLNYALKGEKPPLSARNLVNLGEFRAKNVETFIGQRRLAKAAEATFSATESTWLIPSKVRSETKGAVYDFTAYAPEGEEEAAEILKRHGLDSVKAEGSFSWDWDGASGAAGLRNDFESDGLADFDLSVDLAGLQIDRIETALENGDDDAVASLAAFKGLHMRLADEKMLDAIYDLAALQMGGTGADLRQSTPAMVRLSGAQAAQISPRFADYVEAVAAFLGEGGVIEVAAHPEKPVPFAQIATAGAAGPQAVPDLLDLKVTHKKK